MIDTSFTTIQNAYPHCIYPFYMYSVFFASDKICHYCEKLCISHEMLRYNFFFWITPKERC